MVQAILQVWNKDPRALLAYNLTLFSDLAVFEPGAKHTFDAAAGKNVANPTAALLASAKLLQV